MAAERLSPSASAQLPGAELKIEVFMPAGDPEAKRLTATVRWQDRDGRPPEPLPADDVEVSPWRKMIARGRRGFSLVEMLAALTVGSVLLGIAVSIVALLLRVDAAGGSIFTTTPLRPDWPGQFRDDVHAATRLAPAVAGEKGLWRLVLAPDRTVTYRALPQAVEREEAVAGKPARRESYTLPPGRSARVVAPADTRAAARHDPDRGVLANARARKSRYKDRRRCGQGSPVHHLATGEPLVHPPTSSCRLLGRQLYCRPWGGSATATPTYGAASMCSCNHRRGAIMVAVILCLIVVVGLLVCVVKQVGMSRQAQQSSQQSVQAGWLAEAGVERAAAHLAANAVYAGETWQIPAAELGRQRCGRGPRQGGADGRPARPVADPRGSRLSHRAGVSLPASETDRDRPRKVAPPKAATASN